MEVIVAVSLDFGISSEEFARTWNTSLETRRVAEARPVSTTPYQFDPSLLSGVLIVLGNVALSLASNALYDLIKKVLVRKGHERVALQEVTRPDRTKVLVVTKAE
jgi:hypothetical protein